MISKFNEYVPVFAKVLFLNFNIASVSEPGTEDEFAEGFKRTPSLYKKVGRSRGLDVNFKEYSDLVIQDDKCVYVDDVQLKDFDFVVLGLMAKKMETANLLLDYLKCNDVKFFSYGTPSDKGNKMADMYKLLSNGLPYIPSFVTSNSKLALKSAKDWGFPVIVKELNSSQGDGVYKAGNKTEFLGYFNREDKSKHPGNTEEMRMVQKFIENEGDYRVLLFNFQPIAVARRWSKDKEKEFRNNLSKGGSGEVAELPQPVLQIAINAAKILDKRMAGVDLIQDSNSGEWYIMEVNSSPQYHYFAEISGLDFPGLIFNYISSRVLNN